MLRFIGLVFTLFALYVTVRNSGCAPPVDEIELWPSDNDSSDSSEIWGTRSSSYSPSSKITPAVDSLHPSNLEVFDLLEDGMSFRVKGPSGRVIPLSIYSYTVSPRSWGAGSLNASFCVSPTEDFEYELTSSDRGCVVSIFVPVASEVSLELLKNGQVIRTESSSVPGTILKAELGDLPYSRETSDFSHCKLSPELSNFRGELFRAIKEGTAGKLEATEFFKANALDGFRRFTRLMKTRYGEFQGDGPDVWISQKSTYYGLFQDGFMMEGSIRYRDADVALYVFFNEGKLHFVKYLTPDNCDWIVVKNDSDEF